MVITAATVRRVTILAAKLAAQRREKALRVRKIKQKKHPERINQPTWTHKDDARILKQKAVKPIQQIKGTSTGLHQKLAFQRRREQQLAHLKQRKQQGLTLRKEPFQSLKPNFGKATPEQIALRKKKDARLAAIEARRYERSHRGGFKKTKEYKKKKVGVASHAKALGSTAAWGVSVGFPIMYYGDQYNLWYRSSANKKNGGRR